MPTYLQQLYQYFRNLTLNSIGASRELHELLADRDVNKALELMQDRDVEVDQAIKEYNPQTHDVMKRPNKYRKSGEDYITEKLPRTRQRYINEVELFFLLGNPIIFSKREGDDEAFGLFTDFLREQHFNSRLRQVKRLAGAETEAALLYHVYRADNADRREVKSVVLARSTGYRLRPLFDQYGNMTAFGYGYVVKEGGRNVQHWDFQTPDLLAYCHKAPLGWAVDIYPNPTGKINVIYFQQPKAWDGTELRIHREEMLDSKTADTNNYFADPIAMATVDVIDSMTDPDKPGKLIQLRGENSRFGYVNPPMSSETRRDEKADLQRSILFDSYTPDFSFESMKGMGTLSGAAIKNAMILGYIKRAMRLETYDEMMTRHNSLVIALLSFLHPDKASALEQLAVDSTFAEPFATDERAKWNALCSLYSAGLLSLEEAVEQLGICDHPDAEVERLKAAMEAERQANAENKAPHNKGFGGGDTTAEAKSQGEDTL